MTTYVQPNPEPEDEYGWAFTGAMNSLAHIAKVEAYQTHAIDGTGIYGDSFTEIRPREVRWCPRCVKKAKAMGLDPAKIGLENDLV